MRLPKNTVKIRTLASIFWLTLLHVTHAQAGRPFFDFGVGLAQISGAEAAISTDANGTLSFGTAFMTGAGWDFAEERDNAHFNVGFQVRQSSGSNDTGHFTYLAAYPFVRIEANRIFVSLGATISPLVQARAAPSAGFDGYLPASGAIAVMTEVGYEWKITPQVMFTGSAGVQIAKVGDVISPKPSLEVLGGLRFYLGGPSNFQTEKRGYFEGERDKSAYPGWRYPFGTPL